jgi:transcriptional regulator with XRE-family HTH domain
MTQRLPVTSGQVPVGRLLDQARATARLSVAELARSSGVSRGALHSYLGGSQSPTVRTLDRLLAACGLQARVLLEPLMADLDERVDALEGPLPALDQSRWADLVASLNDEPGARDAFMGRAPRSGSVTWAVDGATALVLHALAAEPTGLKAMDVVVRLDEALRFWMWGVNLRGVTHDDRTVLDWLEADSERIVSSLGGAAERWCGLGFVRVRVLTEDQSWPPTARLLVPWADQPLPVVTGDEVERSNPVYAEVLARWRERRAS